MGCCCKVFKLLGLICLGIILYQIYKINQTPNLPILEENPWWSAGKPSKDNAEILSFKIQIPQKVKMQL